MNKKQQAARMNGKVEDKTLALMRLLGSDPTKADEYDANWSEVDPALITWLITLVAQAGGAVMFGKSRRGDQYHVAILAGEKRQNFWFGGNEAGRELFDEWCRTFCTALEMTAE